MSDPRGQQGARLSALRLIDDLEGLLATAGASTLPRAQAAGLLDALSRRVAGLDDETPRERFEQLKTAFGEHATIERCLGALHELRRAVASGAPKTNTLRATWSGPNRLDDLGAAPKPAAPSAQLGNTKPSPVPAPWGAAPAPAAPAFTERPKSGNRIVFEDLDREVEAAFANGMRERSPSLPELEASASDDTFAAFEALNLRWLASEEIESLDHEIAKVTEPSGLINIETLRSTVKPSVLPKSPQTSFEDSGLFELFVDDSAVARAPASEPESSAHANTTDDADDELDVPIDVDAPVKLSRAQETYLRFLERMQRITSRLFDSLELALVGNQYIELVDVNKQLNRLARLLDFVGLDRQISLIAYMQRLLPLAHGARKTYNDCGRLEIHRSNLAGFLGKVNELIDCLVYFVGYLVHELPGFDRERCERWFVKTYAALGISPAEPSEDAPLGPYGHADDLPLTSRARAMVARVLMTQLDALIRNVESALLHGVSSGYRDAVANCVEMLKVLEDHNLDVILDPIAKLADLFASLKPMERPDTRFLALIEQFVRTVTPLLSMFNGEEALTRARTLVARVSFSERVQTGKMGGAVSTSTDGGFSTQWGSFRAEIEPDLERIVIAAGKGESLRKEQVRALRLVAAKHGVVLLERLLATLQDHWDRAASTCSGVLQDLAASIRALPVDNAQYGQLEALARSVIDELVRRRSADAKAAKPSSEDISTVVLRLVSRLDAFSKEIVRVVRARDFGALASLREQTPPLIDEARKAQLHALGVAVAVIAEICALATDPRHRAEDLYAVLGDAAERLEACLNLTVEQIEELENRRALQTIDQYFEPIVCPDKSGRRINLAFARALHATVDPPLQAMHAMWAEFRPNTVPSPEQAEAYQRAIDKLLQFARYARERIVLEKVVLHRNAFAEALSDPSAMSNVRRAFIAMADEVHNLLPVVDELSPNRAGQHFAVAVLRWVERLSAQIDGAPPNKANWTPTARQALDELAPLARESGLLPFLALVAELGDVTLGAATEVRPERSVQRLEQLAYWMLRVVTALVPSWTVEGVELAADEPFQPCGRVDLASLGKLGEQLEELRNAVQGVRELVDSGPIRVASRSGKDSMTELEGKLFAIGAGIERLVPAELATRLEQLVKRLRQRARVLRKPLSVDFQLDDSPFVHARKSLGSAHRLAIEAVLGALELLAEAIVDHAFGPRTAKGHVEITFALEPEAVQGAVWHNGRGVDLPSIRKVLVASGFTPAFDEDILESLHNQPEAASELRGGAPLCLARASLLQHKGKLEIVGDDEATIFQATVKVAEKG